MALSLPPPQADGQAEAAHLGPELRPRQLRPANRAAARPLHDGSGPLQTGRLRPERVIMFEKSPSAFGVEPVQVGSNPIRLQSKIKIYNTFPLRVGAGAAAEGAAAVGDGDHALEAEPGDGQQQGPGAAPGDNPVPDTGTCLNTLAMMCSRAPCACILQSARAV